MKQTKWKVIKDFELYEVSDSGDVKKISTQKLLKKTVRKLDFPELVVGLRKTEDKNVYFTKSVARLVAGAFITNKEPSNDCVGHYDNDKSNNDSHNLFWASKSQLKQKALDEGRAGIGENHHKSKLKAIEVEEIRALYAGGKSQKEIGMLYGVSQMCISYIVRFRNWKNQNET